MARIRPPSMALQAPVHVEQDDGTLLIIDLRKLARTYTKDAILTIVGVMKNKKASPGVRLTAADMLLNRGWGKPVQAIEQDNNDVTITIRKVLEDIENEPKLIEGEP